MHDGQGVQAFAGLTDGGFDGTAALALRPAIVVPARRAELIAHFSAAFDLGELQEPGHACRVAHIALGISSRLGLDAPARRRVLYAALLHDAGIGVRRYTGDTPVSHTEASAWVARRFGLDDQVQDAIRATHERWDGRGRPSGRKGASIPTEALIVTAAHWACDEAETDRHPLRARARLSRAGRHDIEPLAGTDVADALFDSLRDDHTWISLWDETLPSSVAAAAAGEARSSVRQVEHSALAMGDVIDSVVREPGRARRVSALAVELSRRLGLGPGHRRAIAVAGLLLDIGQLGVPRHILEKPAILTVEEMEQMRTHPETGARIIERIPGLEEVAAWIAAHHERPDGRGYPGMAVGDAIPQPARILAIADAYCALRAERPYRPAMTVAQALAILEEAAGQQFDQRVVDELPAAIEVAESRPVRFRDP